MCIYLIVFIHRFLHVYVFNCLPVYLHFKRNGKGENREQRNKHDHPLLHKPVIV